MNLLTRLHCQRHLKEELKFSMNKNDITEIEITGMTDDGSGVGHADGIAVFVPYTIVGEKVRVLIIKVNKTYAIGKLLEVILPSQHRIKSECPYFYKCGGCQLMHMDYTAELAYKRQKVSDCIKRIGGIDTEVGEVIPSVERFRYRNKVQMPVTVDGIGFYRRNSHNVIDMEDCMLQSEHTREIMAAIRKWMEKYGVAPYNETDNSGVIRHIYTRESDNGICLVIVSTKDELPYSNELVECILELNISISGILLNVNNKKTNMILGKEYKTIWGENIIKDKIGGAEFEISPASFYQINRQQTQNLYSVAEKMAMLSGKETVYDIYCGIGTIGQFMAKRIKKLVGIEIVPQAVENAKKNAELNGIDNAVYYCGAAEKLTKSLIKKEGRPDVIILDPPRKGCDEALLTTVAEAEPDRIVYISCKPSTLARDLKFLATKGYYTKKITPVDMFPCTEHVECVVLMSRKDK